MPKKKIDMLTPPPEIVEECAKKLKAYDPFGRARRKDGKMRKERFPGWTDEMKEKICELLVEGATIREVCAFRGFPSKAELFRELAQDEEFAKAYGMAKEIGAGTPLEEGLDVGRDAVEADGGENVNKSMVAHRYMQIGAIYAEKMAPKKYGQLLKLGGDEDTGPIQIQVVNYATLAKLQGGPDEGAADTSVDG